MTETRAGRPAGQPQARPVKCVAWRLTGVRRLHSEASYHPRPRKSKHCQLERNRPSTELPFPLFFRTRYVLKGSKIIDARNSSTARFAVVMTREDGEQTHQLPLHSLLHPHLHAVLNISAQAGLPTPKWTATHPHEKRSISSDKTITPGSSSSARNPKLTLQVQGQPSSAQQQQIAGDGHLSSSPSKLPCNWPLQGGIMASSPTSEPSFIGENQSDFSASCSPTRNKRKDNVVDPFAKKKEERLRQQHSRPKTENELWIEVADAVKVVADGLREGEE